MGEGGAQRGSGQGVLEDQGAQVVQGSFVGRTGEVLGEERGGLRAQGVGVVKGVEEGGEGGVGIAEGEVVVGVEAEEVGELGEGSGGVVRVWRGEQPRVEAVGGEMGALEEGEEGGQVGGVEEGGKVVGEGFGGGVGPTGMGIVAEGGEPGLELFEGAESPDVGVVVVVEGGGGEGEVGEVGRGFVAVEAGDFDVEEENDAGEGEQGDEEEDDAAGGEHGGIAQVVGPGVGGELKAVASFSRRWVERSRASLLRTAMPKAAGSPTMKTFFLPRVMAV